MEMTPVLLILLLLLLQTKHLIVDWVLQPTWMWSNKHIYGHPGGLVHAGLNGITTALIISSFFSGTFWAVAMIDSVAHYHIDWAKMNINKKMGWGPTTHAEFWWLTGLDQFAHQITYLLILLLIL